MKLGEFLTSPFRTLFRSGIRISICCFNKNGERYTICNINEYGDNIGRYLNYEIVTIESDYTIGAIIPIVFIMESKTPPTSNTQSTSNSQPTNNQQPTSNSQPTNVKDMSVTIIPGERNDKTFLQGTGSTKAIPYKTLKDMGVFKHLMPNGFSIYLDDLAIDDCLDAELAYDMTSMVYKTKPLNEDSLVMVLTSEELEKSFVTGIGSDMTDFCTPAVWIIPCNEFYNRYGSIIKKEKPTT